MIRKRSNMRNTTKLSILAICAVAISSTTLSETREWNGKNGSAVKAEFLSQDGKVVKLMKADGKTISVPISKLSTADQQFLLELANSMDQSGLENYYAVKFVVSSTARIVTIKFPEPWKNNVHIIELIKDDKFKKARSQNRPPPAIIEGWTTKRDLSREENSEFRDEGREYTDVETEYLVYLKNMNTENFKFLISKDSAGVAKVKFKGFNPKNGKTKNITSCTLSGKLEEEIDVPFKDIISNSSQVEYTP
jgi:hypothetical protein